MHLQILRHSIKLLTSLTLIVSIFLTPLFTSCASRSSDIARFNAEKKRIEKERSDLEAALLARNQPAKTNSEESWSKFRSANPYNLQTIALSAPDPGDNSRTLIVSEPPPQITAGQMLFSLQNILLNHSIKTQNIGYDGWVKDIVIAVKGSEQEVASAISDLNILLFDTSYKAYTLPLPPPPRASVPKLNLNVKALELKAWVIDGSTAFSPVAGGSDLSSQEIFKQKICDVFTDANIGVTGWWIPKGKTIGDCRVQARQFAVESDLVLGAISPEQGIFLLGRTRVVPLDILPPLRVETIEMLAATQTGPGGHLAQSYRRNFIYAGPTGEKDWAPICLSPELVDTEYGSLLNITDQILKSWSNSGETEYVGFENYTKPQKMPFPKPLLAFLDIQQVIYNWNTAGAGHVIYNDEYGILGVNRTGSLPVTYIADDSKRDEAPPEVKRAMETGYEYFSRLNDPNLVRVVQYSSIFQIFSVFDIAKPETKPASSDIPDTALKNLVTGISKELQSADLNKLSEQISSQIPFEYRPVGVEKEIKQQLEVLKTKDVSDCLKDQTPSKISGNWMSYLAKLKELPQKYKDEVLDKGKDLRSWIHTPVVVFSKTEGGIGGHNLDARVPVFKLTNGAFEVKSGGGLDPGRLAKFQSEISGSVRQSRSALEIPSAAPAGGGGGNFNNFSGGSTATDAAGSTGWGGRFRAMLGKSNPKPNPVSEVGVTIQRSETGSAKIFIEGKTIEAFTPEDAVDAVAGLMRRKADGEPIALSFEGFRNEEVEAFVRSLDIRTFKANIPNEVDVIISSKKLTPELMASLKAPKYDFTKVTYSNTVIETTQSGLLRGRMDVLIPTAERGQPAAKLPISVEFGKLTPRDIPDRFFDRIRRKIDGLKTEFRERVSAITINRRLKKEIEQIRRETGLDIKSTHRQFIDSSSDLYFALQDDLYERIRQRYLTAGDDA